LALTNAAGVELEPIWANLLAKALEGKNVKELLSNVGSGGGAPAVGAPAAAAGGAAPAADAPAEEKKKEEEKEESDDDMVRISRVPMCSSSANVLALPIGLWSLRLIYEDPIRTCVFSFHIVLHSTTPRCIFLPCITFTLIKQSCNVGACIRGDGWFRDDMDLRHR
jgi:large subunit ribosomal protein LP1